MPAVVYLRPCLCSPLCLQSYTYALVFAVRYACSRISTPLSLNLQDQFYYFDMLPPTHAPGEMARYDGVVP